MEMQQSVEEQLKAARGTLASGRVPEAILELERILSQDPKCVEAYLHLSDAAIKLGQTSAAVTFLTQAVDVAPERWLPWYRLGSLLFELGQAQAADPCFRQCRQQLDAEVSASTRAVICASHAEVLLKLDSYHAAAIAYAEACTQLPNRSELYSNLAFACEKAGMLSEAQRAAEAARELNPDSPEVHNNLGIVARSQHRLHDACRHFENAVRLRPEFALAHFNWGATHLLAGEYAAGWPEYEWRRQMLGNRYPFPGWGERWTGGRVTEGRLIVVLEEGLGDSVQFARFLPAVAERAGADLAVVGDTALRSLIGALSGVDFVDDRTPAVVELTGTSWIALGSVPGVLAVDEDRLGEHPQPPYLVPPRDRVSHWERRFDQIRAGWLRQQRDGTTERPLCVGLAFSGNPAQPENAARRCPLPVWRPLLETIGICWIVLQKGEVLEEEARRDWPRDIPVEFLGPELLDLGETAAVMRQLDLVITVDTSVAHLAGALAVPVWTLLAHTPDWRWQLARADSPWYPTMRLFRQPQPGDWPSVIDAATQALGDRLQDRSNRDSTRS